MPPACWNSTGSTPRSGRLAASCLLGNALKYTPAGGSMAVDVVSSGGGAVLTTSDTGIGMPPEPVAHVFDLFVRGTGALDRSQGGLGIGLALVRQLAIPHGGEASATSSGPNPGSTFIVRLPLCDAGTITPSAPNDAIHAAAPVQPS